MEEYVLNNILFFSFFYNNDTEEQAVLESGCKNKTCYSKTILLLVFVQWETHRMALFVLKRITKGAENTKKYISGQIQVTFERFLGK